MFIPFFSFEYYIIKKIPGFSLFLKILFYIQAVKNIRSEFFKR